MLTQCSFYIGKGGVGKSTSAALASLRYAQSGKKVLLVSLDPAHNLSDIFEIPISDKKVKIESTLFVTEINQDTWVKKYLRDVKARIRESYTYLTAFNLDHYFDMIKYSPGIEEYALFLAYHSIIEANSEYDRIIFDMPPTALTIKFFRLPWLSLQWLKKLSELRAEILEKRKIISRIKLGRKEIESDKIQNRLQKQISYYHHALTLFKDSHQSQVNLVLNSDPLSLKESMRIYIELEHLEISISHLLLNKVKQDTKFDKDNLLAHVPKLYQPQSSYSLLGLDNLKRYLIENH